MDEIVKTMSGWINKTGLKSTHEPASNIDNLLSITVNGLDKLANSEIDDLLLKITSYNLYLKSEKGSILAYISIMEDKRNRMLYSETQKVDTGNKYLSKEEREAIVLSLHPEVAKLNNKLVLLRAKYSKIKDIVHGIDTIIQVIRMYYNRRINDKSEE